VDHVLRLARDERHVQRCDHQLCRLLLAERPAHHLAAVDVENHRQVDESRPGRDVGHVGYPQLVNAGGGELSLHQVWRKAPLLVALGRHAPPPAPADAAQTVGTHHRRDSVVASLDPLGSDFGLDAWHTVGRIAGGMGLADLFQQHGIGLGPSARQAVQPVA